MEMDKARGVGGEVELNCPEYLDRPKFTRRM
jgi:hypothetical protein